MRFTQFNFHPNILSGISVASYTNPTPTQEQTTPPILQGKDVLGLAQTCTGKTAQRVQQIQNIIAIDPVMEAIFFTNVTLEEKTIQASRPSLQSASQYI